MTYFYIIKYRIWKNRSYFIFTKTVDFRGLVDLIVYENNKHKLNFDVMSIRPSLRSFKI